MEFYRTIVRTFELSVSELQGIGHRPWVIIAIRQYENSIKKAADIQLSAAFLLLLLSSFALADVVYHVPT
jgi:hypothetical protein